MAENFLNLKEDMDIQMKLKGPEQGYFGTCYTNCQKSKAKRDS